MSQQKLVDLPVMKKCSKCGLEKEAIKENFRWLNYKQRWYYQCIICEKLVDAIRTRPHLFYKGKRIKKDLILLFKQCTKCSKTLPATTKFFKMTKQRGGRKSALYSWCKKCTNKHEIERYHKRGDAERKRRKEYEDKNRDHLNALARGYRTTIKGIFNECNSKQRKTGRWKISYTDFKQWYVNSLKLCTYCDIRFEDYLKLPYRKSKNSKRLSFDRVNPNKNYELNNVVLACFDCNKIKDNVFTFEEMRKIGQEIIKPKWQKELTKTQQ